MMISFAGRLGTLPKREGLQPGAWSLARRNVGLFRAFTEEKASGDLGARTREAGISVLSSRPLTCVDFYDLAGHQDLTAEIEQALGPNGLGAILIRNVPSYMKLRPTLLRLAKQFASLPNDVTEKYVDADSHYSFGWSHGKESMASGVLDTLKGSFYANPLVDDQLRPCDTSDWLKPWEFQPNVAGPTSDLPTSLARDGSGAGAQASAVCVGGGIAGLRGEADVAELRRLYPGYFRWNLWPREELPELEPAFKDLGRLICAVGCLLAEHCDRYVAAKLGTPPGQVSSVLRRSLNPKARLLHYFAPPSGQDQGGAELQYDRISPACEKTNEEPAWCGLHTDHGSLTGLTAAMYLDELGWEVPNPDPEAGLYIRDRSGCFVCARIPADCIAFQVGEALQAQSGGLLMATPHYVRAPRRHLASGISRNTFAVFMQPDVSERMDCPPGVEPERVAVGQWRPGHTFGEFAEATFERYYGKKAQ